MKKIVVAIACATAVVTSLGGCAIFESMAKSFESNTTKLNRVVELYNYNGELVDTWQGEMRIESESSQSCSFILDGKRTTIYGGIIVTREI